MIKANRFTAVVLTIGAMLGIAITSIANPQRHPATTDAKQSFSVTISALTPKVKAGSPVQLNAVVKNISNHDIQLWRNAQGQEGFVYKIEIKDEKEVTPPDTKFGRNLKGLEDPHLITPDTPLKGSGGWIPVKAGETLTDPINVSRLHEVVNPGKYTLLVRRFDDGSGTFIESNKITITVIP
jgi:hypothetical protein